jgi:hypothetical protein
VTSPSTDFSFASATGASSWGPGPTVSADSANQAGGSSFAQVFSDVNTQFSHNEETPDASNNNEPAIDAQAQPKTSAPRDNANSSDFSNKLPLLRSAAHPGSLPPDRETTKAADASGLSASAAALPAAANVPSPASRDIAGGQEIAKSGGLSADAALRPGQARLARPEKRLAGAAGLAVPATGAAVPEIGAWGPAGQSATTLGAASQPVTSDKNANVLTAIAANGTSGGAAGPLAIALRLKTAGAGGAGQSSAGRNPNAVGAKTLGLQTGSTSPGARSSSPGGTSSGPGGGSNPDSAASPFAAQLKTLTAGLAGSGTLHSETPPAAAGADNSALLLNAGALAPPATQAAAPATAAAEPTATPTAASPVENDALPSGEPVRSVRVQIAGEDHQQVELRMVEHGGALSVSVRSADGTLRSSLQDNLPELNSRLAAEHYQADTWTPGSSASGHSAGQGDSSGGSGGDKQGGGAAPQGDSGSKGGQPQNGQQNGRQNDPPAWVQQLAAFDDAASGRVLADIESPR